MTEPQVLPPTLSSAADELKAALDRHLHACAARTAEEDPAVQEAYDALRDAAERYDDALYDAFDEVTPFEFAQPASFETVEVTDEGVPARVGVLLRRDFAVTDPDAMLDSAADLVDGDGDDGDGDGDGDGDSGGAGSVPEALLLLVSQLGVDELAATADDHGLHLLGGHIAVVAQDSDDATLVTDPFPPLDQQRILATVSEEVID